MLWNRPSQWGIEKQFVCKHVPTLCLPLIRVCPIRSNCRHGVYRSAEVVGEARDLVKWCGLAQNWPRVLQQKLQTSKGPGEKRIGGHIQDTGILPGTGLRTGV